MCTSFSLEEFWKENAVGYFFFKEINVEGQFCEGYKKEQQIWPRLRDNFSPLC